MYTFPTPATARPYWRDMPGDLAMAEIYLSVAKEQVLAYAPPLPSADPEPFVINYTNPVNHITEKYTFTRIGDTVRLEVTGGSGNTSLPASLVPVPFRPMSWFDSGEVTVTFNSGVLQSFDSYWDENPKGVLVALYPAGPMTVQPVTITIESFPVGKPWSITLSRTGDVVNVAVTPSTGKADQTIKKLLPAEFQPRGNVSNIMYTSDVAAGNFYNVNITEPPFPPASQGLNLGIAGSGPWTPHTFQWLGDPLPEVPSDALPENYFLAIITQARNLANSGVAPATTGDFDGSGYGITTFPLDWTVKQMLRPEQGLGAMA